MQKNIDKNCGQVVRSVVRISRAAADQYHDESAEDDLAVSGQRPVINVFSIQPDHVGIIHIAPPSNLPGSSQPRKDPEATGEPLGIKLTELLAVSHLERTGTDQTHVSPEDIH